MLLVRTLSRIFRRGQKAAGKSLFCDWPTCAVGFVNSSVQRVRAKTPAPLAAYAFPTFERQVQNGASVSKRNVKHKSVMTSEQFKLLKVFSQLTFLLGRIDAAAAICRY
jgi:hypothetical protein